MARRIVTVPRGLMWQTQVNWGIDWGGQSSPEALDRSRQIIRNAAARIYGQSEIALTGATARQWRALIWSLRGREGILRLPIDDPLGVPTENWSLADRTAHDSSVPFADGRFFDPDVGFTFAPTVTCLEAVAPGATQIRVDETGAPGAIAVGSFLSVSDWPFAVLSRHGTGADVTLEVALLRVAITAGQRIDFLAHGLFELDDDLQGQGGYAPDLVMPVQLSVTEVLDR